MSKQREFNTKAGLLSGVINERVDKYGILRSCMLENENKISFQGEVYTPKYQNADYRTRYRDAVTFYKSGELKSLYLEEQQEIGTPVGRLKAEFVTFYECGSLHRIFPVYGQISGFWSESEEAELLPSYEIEVGGQKIRAKLSCINFYESGALKSITLWPGERVNVHTPAGEMKARYGVAFYENGCIESVETDRPVAIAYDTYNFISYDNHPIGVHGDKNSLGFYNNGKLKTLKTPVTAVIFSRENKQIRIAPERKISPTDIEKTEIIPIKVEFFDKVICITNSDGFIHRFEMDKYIMKTEQMEQNLCISEEFADCRGCSKCGHRNNERN